jgi:hypothetical protein
MVKTMDAMQSCLTNDVCEEVRKKALYSEDHANHDTKIT